MITTITESDARAQLLIVIKDAIATLPTACNGPHAAMLLQNALDQFTNGSMFYFEFGVSFPVTGYVSVKQSYRGNERTFEADMSYASGTKTLAQKQAMFELIGKLLKAAYTIQTAIDVLPRVEREKK